MGIPDHLTCLLRNLYAGQEAAVRTGHGKIDWLQIRKGTCCSMSSSTCCFLTCIQVSQEAGQVVCYSHLFQNFPQFIVIHTVKGFIIVNKAEIDVFLELSCFFHDPADVGNLISGSSAFSKTSLNIWNILPLNFWRLRCQFLFVSPIPSPKPSRYIMYYILSVDVSISPTNP